MDLDDYQDPLDTYLAYQDGIDMKFLVERLGGSITSERPENEEDHHQGMLFDTGVFSDSDEDEEDRFEINKQIVKKSTLVKFRILVSTDSQKTTNNQKIVGPEQLTKE